MIMICRTSTTVSKNVERYKLSSFFEHQNDQKSFYVLFETKLSKILDFKSSSLKKMSLALQMLCSPSKICF